MMKRTGCLVGLVMAIALPVIGWQALQYVWYQGSLPFGISAPGIEYRLTDTSGLGPGANEVGLVVYRMDEASARKTESGGLAYLQAEAAPPHAVRMSEREARNRRTYWGWRQTPMAPRWTGHGEHLCGRETGIGAFLDQGDFRCRLDMKIVRRIDGILNSEGAYYAEGRGGSVIIVAPRQQLVILAFSG